MPIAFPVPFRGAFFDGPKIMFAPQVLNYVPAPNMQSPGTIYAWPNYEPNRVRLQMNLRELSKQYRDPALTSIVNPAANLDEPGEIFTDERTFDRELGTSRLVMSGVSRDATGAPLGNCRIMAFRTGSNEFANETVSDGSGVWSMILGGSGPFFLVEYLVDAPDKFGTSPNTLIPIPG